MSKLQTEISKRCTFAIISHPDAGKTTITEKILLFGGAIAQAGAIKAKKATKHTTSDWMELEKQRGVSVSTSVMVFEYNNKIINLLDTPGHEDFSEDTYRTLTAVDSVLMVIDSTKGVEERTKKLMDVCRQRDIPVITFMNKLDREGLNPFELLEDLEEQLGIIAIPLSWPISMGKTFKGIYNLVEKSFLRFTSGAKEAKDYEYLQVPTLDDPIFVRTIGEDNLHRLKEDVEMINEILPKFEINDYLAGIVTPVFFGSAINNFGVLDLLNKISELAPSPLHRKAQERTVEPLEDKMTGVIFKIHANMDPKHRDRIAFLRICSGEFTRGMKVWHVRHKREIKIANPVTFLAQTRSITEEAYPGDIVGIHDTGLLKIGDTLTQGEELNFTGIPSFAPEIFRRVINRNPMKSKQLYTGLTQLMEEGVVQLLKTVLDNQLILGAVGSLQFDVVKFRLENEYSANCDYLPYDMAFAYWLKCKDSKALEQFKFENGGRLALDIEEQLVITFKGNWELAHIQKNYPQIEFYKTSECKEKDKV